MIVAALLIAANLHSPHIAQGDVLYQTGDQRWYKDTAFEICPQEHRWGSRDWHYLEIKSVNFKLIPDQVDAWDNGGIDFG